ncbi:MAG: DUF4469 domain-containing protein [Treponema sp.]|nr:DUF4469 domain-containing protein [Treponema sp.]
MEVTKIDFNESKVGKGNIFLYKNQLSGGGGKYLARFERRTINDDIIIARIHERGVGLDDLTVKAVIGLYKKEVVAALGSGESVNMMDLGTMYIRASGSADSRESAMSLMTLQPAFTPSKTSIEAVSSVQISGASFSESGPKMESIVDLYTGRSSLDSENMMRLSAGKVALVRGSRLKIAGEEGGLFFCPIGDDGVPVSDRSQYVQVPLDRILRNRQGELEFFMPDSLEGGRSYSLLVRSNYLGRNKSLGSYREACSDPLLIEPTA